MKLDQPPIYRKLMVPWYDSEIMCLLAIIFLFPVSLLGVVGINVANSTQQYQAYLWMPVLLTMLSAGVIFSMTVRLIRRYLF
jgi:Mg2+ and Co2+ transporter CorA